MISISSTIDKALSKLDRAEKSQVPFALSLALNDTAHDVVADIEFETKRVFDNPTRFTAKAFRFERASKRRLVATVRRKTAQASRHFLKVQSKGGRRPQTGVERRLKSYGKTKTVAPAQGARLNNSGNWSPAQRRAALAGIQKRGSKFFVPRPGSKLSPGIYERKGKRRKIVKLVNFTPRAADYRARLDIVSVARRTVAREFTGHFRKSLRRALATAR